MLASWASGESCFLACRRCLLTVCIPGRELSGTDYKDTKLIGSGCCCVFVVQLLSYVWLFATPWTAARQASLSFTISWSLLKLSVHWVGDAIQPSNPLSPSSPLWLHFPQLPPKGLFLNMVKLAARVSTYKFCCCSVTKSCLTLCDPMDWRLPCPSLSPRVCSDSCPLSWWYHPTVSSSVAPFSSCYQSFSAKGYFPVSWFFVSGGHWSFNFSTSPSNKYSGLTSFRTDWLNFGRM